jgi:putative MATE family efflux protein
MTDRKQRDYTSGSLARNVWDLGVPTAASSLLFGLPNLAESYWLGRLGSAALGAASMGMALRLVFISLIMGLSTGGMALVSRHVGAREQAVADRATQQTELLILIASAVLGAIGYAFALPLLQLMGAEGEMLTKGVLYARVIFVGLWAMELIPSMSSLLRSAGSAEWVFRINLLTTGTLLLLQPLLILGWGPLPPLGVRGAAWAFVLGNTAGVVLQQYVFLTGRARVRIRLQGIGLDRHMIGRILRVALPTTAERFMPNLAHTIMLGLVAAWGTTVLAGYNVTSRVFGLTRMVSMGLGGVAPTLVGQNLGAQKPERAERSAWVVAGVATGLVVLALIPLAILTPQAIALFTTEPEVIAVGTRCLRIMATGQAFLTLALVISMALRGAGDTLSTMWISTGTLWLVQIPLAYGLPRMTSWGATGLWVALTITPLVTAAAVCLRFRQGKWKLKQV